MTTITVTVNGLDALLERYKNASQKVAATLDRAVDVAAQKLADTTKGMPPVSARTTGYGAVGVPVDTGLLRQSIVTRKRRFLAADVVANTDYSLFVQEGTAKMPSRPFFRWAYEEGGMEAIKGVFLEYVSRLLHAE